MLAASRSLPACTTVPPQRLATLLTDFSAELSELAVVAAAAAATVGGQEC